MKLTHAERTNIEALFHALSDEFDCCAADMIPPDLYAVVESVVAARLEQQRGALAAAIEDEFVCCDGSDKHGGGICYWSSACARIVREYEKED